MIDRRSFVANSGLFILAGCATCRLPEPRTISGPVADAHAHFFNASDLPVRGFMRYVLAPAYFPDLPEIVLAMADLAAWLAKRLSLSARAELRQLDEGQLFGADGPGPEKFGKEAAAYQQQMIGNNPKAFGQRDPLNNLADSHYYLALLLGAMDFGAAPSAGDKGDEGRVRVRPDVYRDIALKGAAADSPGVDAMKMDIEKYGAWISRSPIQPKAILRWIYVMCQPRCSHVRTYQATIATSDNQVAHATNLLVDYDRWLGDGPLPASAHDIQVEYWTRYADKTANITGALKIHTFAGFDPLRHAGERLSGAAETTLDRMKAWAREGRRLGSHATHRIAGFKIYPPMGFRPDSNSAMQLPQCSDPRDCRAATEVRNWWTGEGHGWDLSELGTELDRSLDLFFRFCAQEDIPIMSHSRPSNGSMAGADWKALPHYWLNRARMVREYGLHPLRACLGHFDGRPENAQVLIDGLRMNKAQTGGKPHARLYFDVSFDDDILDGQPNSLLDSLASSCREAEDNGNYIMFGSDWIMLGQRSEAADYLRSFRDAASIHPFWHDKVDKLFRQNFIDFMNLPG